MSPPVPPGALRRRGPLVLALAILLVAVSVLVAWSLRRSGGQLVYALDDAYIHMAMARNLAEHGVFGVTRYGYHRLLIFLAFPYWAGLLVAQWSTLIVASAFLPLLLPATMVKPQVGLPVAITYLSRRGILACVVVALLSVAVMPRWPLLWLGQLKHYEHFFPLLILPGPLLLLALWRYRDRDTWFLLLTAIMPQRWFFDAFILWLIPKSRREIVWTGFFSWGAGIWRWYHPPLDFTQVGRWAVLFLYLPMLGVILARLRNTSAVSDEP